MNPKNSMNSIPSPYSVATRQPTAENRQPVSEITRDAVRAGIDSRLVTEVLGFPPQVVAPDGPLALLRQKLSLEPSITRSKSACQHRPSPKNPGGPLHISSDCVAIHVDTDPRTPDIKPVFLPSKAWPSLDSLVSDALER